MPVKKYKDPADGLWKPELQLPIGPQGPQGIQGIQGIQGLTGPTGPMGEVTNASLTSTLAAYALLASPTFTGDPKAPTPALTDNDTSIATTAFVAGYAAAKATVGNLLTANQASGTDTLGTTVGFVDGGGGPTLDSSATWAYSGNKSLRITTNGTGANFATARPTSDPRSGIPVTPGQVITAQARPYQATPSEAVYVRLYFWDSSGNYVGYAASGVAPLTGTIVGVTAVVPALAVYADMTLYRAGGIAGSLVYADSFGLWAGAGGDWAMPGTPITNLGTKTTHPNVDDVLVQRWDEGLGRWQTIHYDSGWRRVSSFLNGWTGGIDFRRVGSTVRFRITASTGLNGTAATATTFLNPAATLGTGWAPALVDSISRYFWYKPSEGAYGTGFFSWNVSTGEWKMPGYGAANDKYVQFLGIDSWITNDPIPTSLPGTLLSTAPA